jgi:cytochrome-b5 reductase
MKHFYFIFSTFTGWPYSVGFINLEMIQEHLFKPSEQGVVLMCGPPPMINFACIPNLEKAGFTQDKWFSF